MRITSALARTSRHLWQTHLSFDEVPGKQIGLLARKDMIRLKTNIYMREEGVWLDFESLNLYSKLAPPVGARNKLGTLDLLQFDANAIWHDPCLEGYRVEEVSIPAYLAVEVPVEARVATFLADLSKDCQDAWIEQAVIDKRTCTLPSRVSKAIERLRHQHRILFEVLEDNRNTFVWELFAGAARLTEMIIRAGHRAGCLLYTSDAADE